MKKEQITPKRGRESPIFIFLKGPEKCDLVQRARHDAQILGHSNSAFMDTIVRDRSIHTESLCAQSALEN